ncbi:MULTISPECIES: hypothetical protein [Comamonadaceae]|uniref:hypothetical protein n=1 Tax=Acidovorax sacchari TaxID=3230736 RepID=UPI0034A28BA3
MDMQLIHPHTGKSAKLAIATLFIAWAAAISGCSTLAPEREAAENLMGKNIAEAYKVFGNPWLVGTETKVDPSSKFYGHKFYFFEKRRGAYDQQKLVGSSMDTSQGRPVYVEHYRTERVQPACQIGFWADKNTNIIDYYQVKGDCGWGGLGLGQTFR